MSKRPLPTESRPRGSTNANGAKSRDSKIARAKRYNLSPYPLCAQHGKNISKQGFTNTRHLGRY